MARSGLGKGLGALIGTPSAATRADTGEAGERVHQINLANIIPSALQPRKDFAREALQELIDSIRQHGIIQPLIVRPATAGVAAATGDAGRRFELIAGERRWRAAQRAGLKKVSTIVRQVSDEIALEMTLVENIQREDLNPLEAARAFERLMDEFQLTQESVAERTGKDRATVANAIRLLKLEPTIQEWIEEAKLTAGHGRALLAVIDPQLRMRYAQRASRGGLTVRQIERLASRHARGRKEKSEIHVDPNVREALDELQRHLGTKIFLRQRTKLRPGQLVLEYYEDAQLMGLYDRLMK